MKPLQSASGLNRTVPLDSDNTEDQHSFFVFKEKAGGRNLNKKEELKPTDQNLPITPELLSQIDHAVAVSFGLDGMLNPKEKEEDPDGSASG